MKWIDRALSWAFLDAPLPVALLAYAVLECLVMLTVFAFLGLFWFLLFGWWLL